jgi:hypothetical protein
VRFYALGEGAHGMFGVTLSHRGCAFADVIVQSVVALGKVGTRANPAPLSPAWSCSDGGLGSTTYISGSRRVMACGLSCLYHTLYTGMMIYKYLRRKTPSHLSRTGGFRLRTNLGRTAETDWADHVPAFCHPMGGILESRRGGGNGNPKSWCRVWMWGVCV